MPTLEISSLLLMTAAGVWAAYSVTGSIGDALYRRATKTSSYADEIFVSLVVGTSKVLIVILGFLLLAEALSLDYRTVLAGLGVGGLAVAIAAKDTIANLFGSAVVLADRPFRRGDLVRIGNYEGYVETVGMRSTQMRTLEDSVVVIPNNALANEIIDNLERRRKRRVLARISVTYGTPPDKLDAFSEQLREVVLRHPKGLAEKLAVGVWEFGPSSIDLELTCYLSAKTRAEESEARHGLLVDIMRLAKELGVEFAFPTRTLYVRPDEKDDAIGLEQQAVVFRNQGEASERTET